MRAYFRDLKMFFIYLPLDRGEGRKRGREASVCGCLSLAPLLGTWPATQACALTENGTGDPLVHSLAFNPLSHTSQGCKKFLHADYLYLYFILKDILPLG